MKTIVLTFDKADTQRRENASRIADKVKGEVYIGTTNCNENISNILALNDDILLFEDDVVVDSIELKEIKNYIKNNNDTLINFHFLSNELVDSIIEPQYYSWNQCIYIPKDVCKKILRASYEYRFKNENDNEYAKLIRFGLEKNNLTFFATAKNLVRAYLTWKSAIR